MKYLMITAAGLIMLCGCTKNVGYNHSAVCHRISAELNTGDMRGYNQPPHTAATEARWAREYHRLGCDENK